MTDWQTLGELVEALMAEWSVPGVSVGILQGGEFEGHGYGVTSVENPLPVTPETLFQVGSIS